MVANYVCFKLKEEAVLKVADEIKAFEKLCKSE